MELTRKTRALVAVAAWLVLTLSLAVPQALVPVSRVLAGVVGFGLLAGWCALLLFISVTPKMGLIGAGVGVVVVALTHFYGTEDFQAARLLAQGRALEQVPLAEVLTKLEDGVWVSLSDARVRSEATHEVTMVSGSARDGQGRPQAQTRTTYAFAPITLASEVSQEMTALRRKPVGRVKLWACASSSGTVSAWDTERQAVRGRLSPMKSELFVALSGQLVPELPVPIPGAGAIPAAPGAGDPMAAPPVVERLSLGTEAWCVHLDRWLTAAEAKENAVGSALVFLFTIPLFAALFAFFLALLKNE